MAFFYLLGLLITGAVCNLSGRWYRYSQELKRGSYQYTPGTLLAVEVLSVVAVSCTGTLLGAGQVLGPAVSITATFGFAVGYLPETLLAELAKQVVARLVAAQP